MLRHLRKFIPKERRSLQTRFQVGLAIILFIYCLTAVFAVYSLQRNMLEREALRQTQVVMDAIGATRAYVREVLRPRMFEILPPERFVIEAMSSSYISRVTMENFNEKLPEFNYRRVARNARNPDFTPNSREKEMIDFFQNNKETTAWSGIIRTPIGRRFIQSQPVVFNDSCMRCHGKAEDAPADILARYGDSRGFQHQSGRIGGLVSVSIPLDSNLSGIQTSALWILLGILGSSLILYIFIRLFFQQLVVSNLQSLVSLFRESVGDGDEAQLYQDIASKDELRELYKGTRLLAQHVRRSRDQLRQHASRLEQMVAHRTEALERSHDQLSQQMRQRNRELHLFTSISELTSREESLTVILRKVLENAGDMLPGEDVAIYLRTADGNLELCSSRSTTPMAEFLELSNTTHCSREEEMGTTGQACNHIRIIDEHESSVAIPLCCRNRDLGVMLITGLHHDSLSEPVKDLLLSIGNQIGIAVESIQNTTALRNSEKLLQSVFNGISDPLVLLDNSGLLKMVNEAFLRFHNLERNHVLGRHLRDVVGRENCFIDTAANNSNAAITSPQSRMVTTEDGFSFDVLLYPVIEQNGSVGSIICLARDVTATKEVERKMRQTEKLAAIGQLAAGVAHEINNPLSIILCHTDIVKNEYSVTEELKEDIETIERHALNCRSTVSDLLNFARTKDSAPSMQLRAVNDDIRLVVSMVEIQFAKQQIEIVTDLDKGEPQCFMDYDRIQQVLINLLMNSAQAIDTSGTIRVSSQATGEVLRITIEDDGPGIPLELKDKIFDPFFTTKEQTEGTGLGLSVSFGIIADHGGDISVASKPGKTTFTINLPLTGHAADNTHKDVS
jgi:PAS domain S-box-containing protein